MLEQQQAYIESQNGALQETQMALQEMRREMEKLKRGQEIHYHHQKDQNLDKMKGKMHEEYNSG